MLTLHVHSRLVGTGKTDENHEEITTPETHEGSLVDCEKCRLNPPWPEEEFEDHLTLAGQMVVIGGLLIIFMVIYKFWPFIKQVFP